LSSGLRNSEFCCLAIGDTIVGTGESVFLVRRPASMKRKVYVSRTVSNLIERYVSKLRPRLMPDGVDANDMTKPLIINEHRRPFDRTTLYRRVVRILTEAGLGSRANVQLLRHTYGYLAYLRTGGNLLFVQRQLGHAHIATTSMYAELVEESYPDLAERVLPGAGPAAAIDRITDRRRTQRFNCEVD
jgi:integrase/recombinase XerD